MGKPLSNKKIAMIIAFIDFRDEEYFIPKTVLESEGANIVTASSKKGQAIGAYGGVVDVDVTLDDLKVSDFDAIIFVGGSGAAKYIDDEKAHKITQEAVNENKILGAICIAPAILAKAGVLNNKKATVWSNNLDKSAIKILKEEGVNYQDEPVVVDDKIITANGPLAARKFGEKIVEVLTKK